MGVQRLPEIAEKMGVRKSRAQTMGVQFRAVLPRLVAAGSGQVKVPGVGAMGSVPVRLYESGLNVAVLVGKRQACSVPDELSAGKESG